MPLNLIRSIPLFPDDVVDELDTVHADSVIGFVIAAVSEFIHDRIFKPIHLASDIALYESGLPKLSFFSALCAAFPRIRHRFDLSKPLRDLLVLIRQMKPVGSEDLYYI